MLIRKLNILAFSDVHAPRYLPLFIASLNAILNYSPDIIILAGDIIDHGRTNALSTVVNPLCKKFPNIPIVAIFGNEEYFDIEDKLINSYSQITWLSDSVLTLTIKGIKICIVGSRGVLEKPTPWQRKNIKGIEYMYKKRVEVLRDLLVKAKQKCEVVILVTHYAPTFITVKGEPFTAYPYLGSRSLERILRETQIDLVIHGHAHNSRVLEASLGITRIYNVALPARKGITKIEFHKVSSREETQKGLLRFLKVKGGEK
ncbi:MAG: metallophosphoesterase [Thermoprotei archaeon]|nr:MAG: metallophosphoesterase [Thermoprotei archaeon]